MFASVLVVLLLFCDLQDVLALKEGDRCRTSKGIEGTCKLRTNCTTTTIEIENGTVDVCGFADSHPVICCTEELSRHRRQSPRVREPTGSIAQRKCKEYARYALLVKNNSLSSPECPFEREKLDSTGSVLAGRGEFPHAVQIGFGPKEQIKWICMGAIISEYYVLTSGHCLTDRRRGEASYIRAGVTNLLETNYQQRRIIEVLEHPLYAWDKVYFDIGLIKVSSAFDFTPRVRPACLQARNQFPKTNLRVCGWGRYASPESFTDDMKRATLEVSSTEKCNKTFSNELGSSLHVGIVEEYMFCAATAGGRSPCMIEFGGPIQYYKVLENKCIYTVTGVMSAGIDCNKPDIPLVYSSVPGYIKWIEDIVWT